MSILRTFLQIEEEAEVQFVNASEFQCQCKCRVKIKEVYERSMGRYSNAWLVKRATKKEMIDFNFGILQLHYVSGTKN